MFSSKPIFLNSNFLFYSIKHMQMKKGEVVHGLDIYFCACVFSLSAALQALWHI